MSASIREVPAFESTDGKLFHSKEEAESHNRRLAFGRWYKEGVRTSESFSLRVGHDILFKWLEENFSALQGIFGDNDDQS